MTIFSIGCTQRKAEQVMPGVAGTWLTISLSDAFSFTGAGAAHFRLVAAVVVR